MQDHPNKRTENPPLDAEDWDNAFEAYKGNPGAALMMGFNLMVLKDCIALDPLVAEEAIDRAIEALYPYTQFHEVCHDMYIKVVGGDLTVQEEEMLKKLGLRF